MKSRLYYVAIQSLLLIAFQPNPMSRIAGMVRGRLGVLLESKREVAAKAIISITFYPLEDNILT